VELIAYKTFLLCIYNLSNASEEISQAKETFYSQNIISRKKKKAKYINIYSPVEYISVLLICKQLLPFLILFFFKLS